MTHQEAESLTYFIEDYDPRFIGEVVCGAYHPGNSPRVQDQGVAVCCIHRDSGYRAALYLFVSEYSWRARVEMARNQEFLDALKGWEALGQEDRPAPEIQERDSAANAG